MLPPAPLSTTIPYGLDKLERLRAARRRNAIKLGYASRAITYLVGEKAAMSDPLPDTSCAAMLEGPDRVTRAMNYNMYLYQAFGEAAGQAAEIHDHSQGRL